MPAKNSSQSSKNKPLTSNNQTSQSKSQANINPVTSQKNSSTIKTQVIIILVFAYLAIGILSIPFIPIKSLGFTNFFSTLSANLTELYKQITGFPTNSTLPTNQQAKLATPSPSPTPSPTSLPQPKTYLQTIINNCQTKDCDLSSLPFVNPQAVFPDNQQRKLVFLSSPEYFIETSSSNASKQELIVFYDSQSDNIGRSGGLTGGFETEPLPLSEYDLLVHSTEKSSIYFNYIGPAFCEQQFDQIKFSFRAVTSTQIDTDTIYGQIESEITFTPDQQFFNIIATIQDPSATDSVHDATRSAERILDRCLVKKDLGLVYDYLSTLEEINSQLNEIQLRIDSLFISSDSDPQP